MLELKNDSWELLPDDVQKRVWDFIENLSKISWFNPNQELKKIEVDKQAKFTLECFWIKAEIEYRKLEKKEDWASAWDSAWASAWDSAWASALDSARDSARDSAWASALASARDSARDSAWDSALASARDSALDSARDSARASAWASAWASAEVLIEWEDVEFNKKYPNGAFKQLFKLWEMGLYPLGVLENWNFVIYVNPIASDLFYTENNLPVELEINGIIYIQK